MKPFESDAGRTRMLYRLPTAPPRGRTLEIRVRGQGPVLDDAWPGESRLSCVLTGSSERAQESEAGGHPVRVLLSHFAAPLPLPAGSVDRIVLHGTLDALHELARREGRRFRAAEFLRAATDLLVPGGLVAGCVRNRHDPRHVWKHLLARSTRRADGVRSHYSYGSCRALLAGAGLEAIRLHTLVPDADSPVKLVELDPQVSRFVFGHELEARRNRLGIIDYWLRRAVLAAGLYPRMEPSMFFWGYRPC
jgi:SAM-dependent methyltransferase